MEGHLLNVFDFVNRLDLLHALDRLHALDLSKGFLLSFLLIFAAIKTQGETHPHFVANAQFFHRTVYSPVVKILLYAIQENISFPSVK